MDEHQLRVMFEDFGPVFQINVLRDKISGQSKGRQSIPIFLIKATFTHPVYDPSALHCILEGLKLVSIDIFEPA